jgi:hypothetical protein
VQNKQISDLGVSGVDGVLLLCSSDRFSNSIGSWYKRVYNSCFRGVPIFIEARHDALFQFYKDVCTINIKHIIAISAKHKKLQYAIRENEYVKKDFISFCKNYLKDK